MGRDVILIPPSHLMNRYTFAFTIDRVTFSNLQTHHVSLIFRTTCNITIHNFIGNIILPVRRVIIIGHHCTDTFRIHVSFRIFPTFLQKQNSCGIIFTGNIRNLTESGSTDTIFAIRHLHLVVELKGYRFLSKRNTGLQHLLWVLSTFNRFMHRPGKNRTGRQHRDIDQSQHLHTFHASIQPRTVSIPSFFRENRCVRLGNSGYFCHHV